MGIKGLGRFVDENHLSEFYELYNCKIVIDGNNLNHSLYPKQNSVFGGDYNGYSAKIKLFFDSLKKCNIVPIVVIDGGLDQSDRFFRTQKERYHRKSEIARKASSSGKCESTIFPIFLVQVFLDILAELKIQFVQCEYDSDAQITALANHYKCPVLSDDNDFYIHDVKGGFIRYPSMEEGESNHGDYYFKRCKIYYVDSFLTKYSLNRNDLRLLASLIGNDFLKNEDLLCFNKSTKIFYRERIPQILEWLQNNGFTKAKTQFLQSTKDSRARAKLEELLNFSMNTYNEVETPLMSYFEDSNIERIIERSILTSPCGERFPKDFIMNYYQGNIPSSFLNIINLHKYFLSNVIEDFSNPSCFHTYRFIRQIIYGILLQHKCSNEEHHEYFCLSDVEEFGRFEDMACRTVTPVFILPNEIPVPKLSDIGSMDRGTLREFMADVMGVEESFFASIPSHLELLFGSINYSVRKSSPKLTDEFISAIILSIIYFEEILQPDPAKSDDNVDSIHSKIYQTLGKILPSDTKQVIENINVYLCEPEICSSNPFDVSVVQSYSQVQACLSHFIFLNNMFHFPFERPEIDRIFEGSLLYNLTRDLINSQDSSIVIGRLLGGNEHYIELFDIMKNIVMENVLEFLDVSKNKRKRLREEHESNELLKVNQKKSRY